MKKIITTVWIYTIVAHGLYAQQITGVGLFAKLGYNPLPGSVSILNKIAGLNDGFKNNCISFGTEASLRANKIILVLDGNMEIQHIGSSADSRAKLISGSGYVKVGWIIFGMKHSWIYPSFGLGVAETNISIPANSNDEAIDLKNKFIRNPSFDMGVNGDFIVNRITDPETYKALLLGLRAGYRFSVKNNHWRDGGGNRLGNMPSYAYNGFYIMATFGGGGYTRK